MNLGRGPLHVLSNICLLVKIVHPKAVLVDSLFCPLFPWL